MKKVCKHTRSTIMSSGIGKPTLFTCNDCGYDWIVDAVTKREEILQKAIQCVTVDRQATHGKPENSFQDIAHLWSWYKGIEFTPQEVSVMMALMKLARIKSNHVNDDNFIDLAGYCALAAELKPQPQ